MKIFFIGIGGISMSGLAMICKNLGWEVEGSDREDSNVIHQLEKKGIKVYIGHNKDHITSDIDKVVFTAAVKQDNEEIVKTKELGIELVERSVFLGSIMEEYENSVAIAGTHGKTTTTSMITLIFDKADKHPTSLIGGMFKNIGGNVEIGSSDIFISEACEYVDSFLQFFPKVAVITNIEEDHLDYFEDLAQIKSSFLKFANQVKNDGFVIANGDDENVKDTLKDCKKKVYYYGFKDDNDFVINNLKYDDVGYPIFDIVYSKDGALIDSYKLSVFGRHNVYNSVAAIVSAYILDIEKESIQKAIEKFTGVGRRFEYIGEKEGVRVFDDYAHHPTEIKSTLEAIKSLKKNRFFSIFQPHTYTRTKALFKDFVECFDETDIVIFADIYAAREPNDETVSSSMLCDEVNRRGKDAYYFDSFEKIVKFLHENANDGDIIFTIGAGDVYKIGKMYLNQ